ncbi:TPA: transglycosylase SLT domain-containing protein [Burkholderia cenocepacia]|nr:transglycosylase SLT domain-containing protein [Burkholderia cenocepacia]
MSGIDLSGIISAAAQRYNLDPGFVHAVVQQESSGNPGAINRAGGGQGAWGAMQVRGPALTDYNRAHGTSYSLQDLLDPVKGVDVGSWYLNQQLNAFNDPAAALSAYKNGAGSPEAKAGTSDYAKQVLSRIGSPSSAADTSGYGGAPAGVLQSGGPAASNTGAAAVLSQFGYGADGKPQAAAAPSSSAPATQGAAAQPSGAAAILSQFGYGADGQPVQSSQAPANQPGVPAKMPAPIASQQTPLAAKQDFLRNVMGVGTPEEASNWQNYVPGGILQGANNVIGGVAQLLSHGAQTLANTALPPTSPLAQMANRWAASEDADAAQRAQSGPTSTSGKVGQFVGEAVPTLGLPGGTLLKAVTGGALAGAAQPVTQNADQNFWAQKGVQTALGAGLGGVGHAAASGLGALVQRFTDQEPAAVTAVRNFLNGQKVSAQPQPEVPGVQPTLSELTGNANLGVAQRQFAEANPQPFAARAVQNTEARQTAFENAVKSPQEAEMAANADQQKAAWQYANSGVDALAPDQHLSEILQRPSMQPVMKRAELLADESGAGNPFQAQRDTLQAEHNQAFANLAGTPEGVQAAKEARNADVFDRYQSAGEQEIPIDDTLQTLMQRPSMQRVIQRAQRLSDEEGGGPLFLHDEEGNPTSLNGGAAHYIKQGLDDEIQLARDNNLGASERRAIQGTQNQFLGWLDNQSPDYASARSSYAQQTQPIEAQEYLQGLNVTDANGNVSLSKLDTALKNTEKLRAQPGLNAAKNLTDDQMTQLSSLRDSLRAAQNGPDVSRFTPEQIQYVQRALDDEIARGTRGATANENQALTQSRSDLENWIGQRAPDYLASKQTAQASQQSLATNQYLQKDISDSMGRLQLNRVEQKIKQIEDAKRLGIDTPAARVDDKTLDALRAIRDSFRVERSAEAMTKGSPTKQNLDARQRLGLTPLAPDAGAAATVASRATGAAMGGAAGWAAGHLVAPGIGGPVGSMVGALVGDSLKGRAAARAAEKAQSQLAKLIDGGSDMFLNPTPELIDKLNNTPGGQRLMQLIDMARARAPGLAGAAGGGPLFRSATQGD